MKYPKPWEAGKPAGACYVASTRTSERAGLIQLGTYINRPGTPDHTRLIRTWLSLPEAEQLVRELSAQIESVKAHTPSLQQIQRRDGVGAAEAMRIQAEAGANPFEQVVPRHELKCWPPYFRAVVDGRKRFELRKYDRDFCVGDVINLREWCPDDENYTGRECMVRVSYKLGGPGFGLEIGYVVMGIELEMEAQASYTRNQIAAKGRSQ